MALPVQGSAYDFYISLVDTANPDSFVTAPTIAAGDFTISTDGSAYANLTTLPVVDPSGSLTVKITVSDTEMTGSKANILGVDVAGAQWEDILITIDIPARTVDTISDTNNRVDIGSIAGSTDAATKLSAHALETLPVTFGSGSTTTVVVLDQVDGAAASSVNDVYVGRIFIFNNFSGIS